MAEQKSLNELENELKQIMNKNSCCDNDNFDWCELYFELLNIVYELDEKESKFNLYKTVISYSLSLKSKYKIFNNKIAEWNTFLYKAYYDNTLSQDFIVDLINYLTEMFFEF